MFNIGKPIFNLIQSIIDFCYYPFRKYMTLSFFRYGVTGSINLVFDWVVYFIIYQYILNQQAILIGGLKISSHIAALGIKIPIVLLFGFMMQKNITFTESNLKGHVQLFRYLIVFLINIFINYLGLKLFVDYFDFYPTPSNMLISIFTIFISYFSQKYYTFKS